MSYPLQYCIETYLLHKMNNENSNRNWKQDKLLSAKEIVKLKQAGFDIHELKNGRRASQKDLYKDK